jgi:hypothetical protein
VAAISDHSPPDPDPSKATSVSDLAAALRRLRLRAGNPALRKIETMAKSRGQSLPRATVGEAFGGKRLPRYDLFVDLVEALGVPAPRSRSWIQAWELIAELQQGPKEPDHLYGDGVARDATYDASAPQPRRPGAADAFWCLEGDGPITLVCGALPAYMIERMPYADPLDPDYIELYTYADPDALLELYGHVRATNPGRDVRIRTSVNLHRDDYATHVVIIGGIDFNALTRELIPSSQLPIVMSPRTDEPIPVGFETIEDGDTHNFRPVLEDQNGRLLLREDVALLHRSRNPFNVECTITICAGIFARGTLGAIRALTDRSLRTRNESYLRHRFVGHDAFGLLGRVGVTNGAVMTPDWSLADNRLFEWPTTTR